MHRKIQEKMLVTGFIPYILYYNRSIYIRFKTNVRLPDSGKLLNECFTILKFK